jgi:hypothetical protein
MSHDAGLRNWHDLSFEISSMKQTRSNSSQITMSALKTEITLTSLKTHIFFHTLFLNINNLKTKYNVTKNSNHYRNYRTGRGVPC